jgi:hypothetical protein
MNCIPHDCSADRCTSLLDELHSIWLQCWPQYLISVRTRFRVAVVLTAVLHFCMNYIPYGYSADCSTSFRSELHSTWLQCWPQYITSVWITFHMDIVLTAALPFGLNYIPRGWSADSSTSLIWTTFHMAVVLTAILHFCMNYIPYGCSTDRSTSFLSKQHSIWLQCWSQYITCLNYIPYECSASLLLNFTLHGRTAYRVT